MSSQTLGRFLNLDWQNILQQYLNSEEFQRLSSKIESLYETSICYPPKDLIFNSMNLTRFQDVRVVIVGQDPYHQPGQAMGLSFSVPKGTSLPPSLKNIFKCIQNDQEIKGFAIPAHGDLSGWALQGVLLLNTVLSVTKNNANSHANIGWEKLTNLIIRKLSEEREGIVFVLWGNHAIKMKGFINENKHHVLISVHPSPLSAH